MKNKITPEQYNLWLRWHNISHMMSLYEDESFSKSEITNQQFFVLMAIAYNEQINNTALTITDLAGYENRSVVSMSAMIERMEKKGFVKKKIRALRDRRAIPVIITPNGKQILKKSAKLRIDSIMNFMSGFSNEDIVTLTKSGKILMERFIKVTNFDINSIDNIKFADLLNRLFIEKS